MAGLLRDEDVALVKEKTNLEDVVSQYVTLSRAGPDSFKGLCPFHDERTPSFFVRPAHGHWYCFGCNQGGDVISFLQEIEHLGFVEAVERLAHAAGVELQRDESQAASAGRARRTRLLEAHRAAEEFYTDALVNAPEAAKAREFLLDRGFDAEAAAHFGVGFSPRGGDTLTRSLLSRGFEEEELLTGGLSGRSARGLYDRFRGRVMWPVRDVTGATVGFGARRLFDDDRIDAKYLNTSETPIYKKTHLLYGLDLAKRQIATSRQAVIVEGYTDVMAMHLAGIGTAVATCGTAFGADHVKVLRRLLRDDGNAEVIFTFDGDAAGQKAAMRAYELDDQWVSRSYVAVAEDGMDPCDLRLNQGDTALARLVEEPTPMFEFAARTTIARYDLDTREGRAAAINAVAPILGSITDASLLRMYVGDAAMWIGVPVDMLHARVQQARRTGARPSSDDGWASRRGQRRGERGYTGQGYPAGAARGQRDARGRGNGPDGWGRTETGYEQRNYAQGPDDLEGAAGDENDAETGEYVEPQAVLYPPPDLQNPTVVREFMILQVLVQYPAAVRDEQIMPLVQARFTDPGLAAVLLAVLSEWGKHEELSKAAWIDLVQVEAGDAALRLVSELSMRGVPTRLNPETGLPEATYVADLINGIHQETLQARIDAATSALRRAEAMDPAQVRPIAEELTELERQKAALREQV